jgi:hypothetical protein
VSVEKEMKVARVLVQAAHPSVIQLLITSGTEIFISYHHTVADLMAVHAWQTHGSNSGLQATEADGTAVYVSAGGDPFFEGEQKTYTTDGFPALARMLVIAGQELGHFADLRRSPHGILGRHSTDATARSLRASPVAAAARMADGREVARLTKAYQALGLARLQRAEHRVAFYHKRLRYSPPWLVAQAWRFILWLRFISRCKKANLLHSFKMLPAMPLGDAIANFLADMAFNLNPDADVYRNPNPVIEEAIKVIEAVARVPQQEHKWGVKAVAFAWPNLSGFYNRTVLPACSHHLLETGVDLLPDDCNIIKLHQRIIISLRRRYNRKPAYYL